MSRPIPSLEEFYDDIAAAYRAEIKISPTPAAGICSWMTPTSPISRDPRIVEAMRQAGEDVATLPASLCVGDQCRAGRAPLGHDGLYPYLPWQRPRPPCGGGRLRAGGRPAVQSGRRRWLFPGVRSRRRRGISSRFAFCRKHKRVVGGIISSKVLSLPIAMPCCAALKKLSRSCRWITSASVRNAASPVASKAIRSVRRTNAAKLGAGRLHCRRSMGNRTLEATGISDEKRPESEQNNRRESMKKIDRGCCCSWQWRCPHPRWRSPCPK